jgi:uncharacterized protein (TIGR00369 family)
MIEEALLKRLGLGSPYFNHLNMELLDAGDGWATLAMDIKPHHGTSHGFVHGGAIASLADQVGMLAAKTRFKKGQRGVTIQMDMHYLAPVRRGRIVAEGRIKKMGGRIAFSEVDVVDQKKRPVAMGRFTIVIVQAGKTEGE